VALGFGLGICWPRIKPPEVHNISSVLFTIDWFQFAEIFVLWLSWCQILWEQCAEGSKSLYRISKWKKVGSYTGCFIAALKVYIENLWNQVCRWLFHGIYFQPEISTFPVWRFSSLRLYFQFEIFIPVLCFAYWLFASEGFDRLFTGWEKLLKSLFSICNIGFCLQNPLHYSVYIMWKTKLC